MIKYKISIKGVIIYTFLSPSQIMKGDFIQCITDEGEENVYIVGRRFVQVSAQFTLIILHCDLNIHKNE